MGVLRAGNGSMTGGIPFVAAFKAGQGEKAGGIGYSESLAPTLGAAQSGTQLSPAIVFGWNKSASQTMRVDADATDAVQAASSSQPAALIGSAVRRLTPLECERLMGYPDNWTQYGVKPNDTQYTVADGPRYQMCGNGWATPVANWVAERLMMVEKLLPPTPPTIKETTPENLNS
jgi:DNA (cytosine-5)-methyltransferase 1